MAKELVILLVDDDGLSRDIYAEVFANSGFKVLKASDGVEGLDIATKEKPDVIFTGIIMPRMDGFSLMEELKKNVSTANIPVAIFSHFGRKEDQERAKELGAKDFIIRTDTPPIRAVERIKNIFFKEEYYIKFDINSIEAHRLIDNLKLKNNLQCSKCKEPVFIKLSVGNDNNFIAKLVCHDCGIEAE
ncbi:MAG: response regulator [Patescibacteria group bacterium]